MEILKAIKITEQTCVGVLCDKYPLNNGNCFSVKTDENKHYRIVNFYCENLKELIKRGLIWPILISPLNENTAIIYDMRIPDSWYNSTYCETCCPEIFLPINQQLTHRRQEERGERRIIKNDPNFEDIKFKGKNTLEKGVVYAPDIPEINLALVHIDMTKQPDFRTEKEKKEQAERLSKWKIEIDPNVNCFYMVDAEKELNEELEKLPKEKQEFIKKYSEKPINEVF